MLLGFFFAFMKLLPFLDGYIRMKERDLQHLTPVVSGATGKCQWRQFYLVIPGDMCIKKGTVFQPVNLLFLYGEVNGWGQTRYTRAIGP